MTEINLPFGIDISRWQYSQDGKQKLDFEAVALHNDPMITFVYTRSGVSWGYQDPWFVLNWDGIKQIDQIRDAHNAWKAVFKTLRQPVGRGVYHVIYPGEDLIRQVDAMFRIVGDAADWDHDRICLDAELDHGYTKRIITDACKKFAYKCNERAGYYPVLYSRTSWLNAYTYPQELTFMPLWLAQYRWDWPYPLYTPEMIPPPNPLPTGHIKWMVHQTTKRGKSIGSSANYFMDYNRWNGTNKDVMEYFNLSAEVEEPTPPEEPLTLEGLDERLTRVEKIVLGG